MSIIGSQLQPGEQVILRITRGRKWYHYLVLVFGYLILAPIIFWAFFYFLTPVLGAFVTPDVALLIVSAVLLLATLGLLIDFIHFLVDELVLTDRRVIGRAQGASAWTFHKLDVPLSVIGSATVSGSSLRIQRKDGKRDVIVNGLHSLEQFTARLVELIDRPV